MLISWLLGVGVGGSSDKPGGGKEGTAVFLLEHTNIRKGGGQLGVCVSNLGSHLRCLSPGCGKFAFMP